MYVVSTQAKDKGKDAKHDGTLGAKPKKDDAHDKMTYCIDTTIYGEALTKTHVRYFQVLPPGAHSPIAFSLEFVWHGPGNLMHTARASERLNSRVVAFVVLRCMGKEHTDWFAPGTEEFDRHTSPGGQRTWTVMVYLNAVEAGGETRFN